MSFLKGKTKAKPFKIQTVVFQRIGRVLLWTLIIFLILRGIGTLFITSEAGEAQGIIDAFIQGRSYQEEVEQEASSFAERFAMEYFTYEGRNPGDYEKRLKEYLSNYTSIGNMGNGIGKMTAVSASTYNIQWFSKNQVNVSLALKVLYEVEKKEGEEVTKEKIERNEYLLVPIKEQEGNYVVEDLPVILPAPKKADISPSYYSGTNLDTNTTREITEVLESFFKTFYSGNPGEISYYMLKSEKNETLRGLENRFTLNRIESVRAFGGNSEGEVFAIVDLTIEDSLSKLKFKQNYNVTLVQKDNRYYIENFDVRSLNLNENKEEI